MKTYPLSIANAKATNNFKEIKSPYDGASVARVEIADSAAIRQALANAARSFKTVMRKMPAGERANILYDVARQ